MSKKFEQFQDMIGRLYPELGKRDEYGKTPLSRTVTFQVTDKCNLACTYCYQINKGERKMKFEYAKKLVDMLLSGDKRLGGYVDVETSPAIIIEFIGGEPFLQVELIEQICDYFVDKAIELCHPWATMYSISICSNGVLYFDEKVQHFLNKYKDRLSFSVTIDGNKELHDACRVFPNGEPSYDKAVAAAKDWMDRGYYMGSKITIAPGNLKYLYDAVTHMVELGYDEINANVVYEKGWTLEHAQEYYKQLLRLADYWIDNNLVDTHYLALFVDTFFHPKDEDDLQNWCGGTGSMLSMDPDGYLYPCIRYMESSLGTDRPPLRIGHVNIGIAQTECDKKCVDCLNKIDRRTESTDECFYCPIAEGCSWCFPAGTKITTPNGLVNIEELCVGDRVIDKDGDVQTVEKNLERKTDELIYVKATGLPDLLTTKEHPFWAKPVISKKGNLPIYGDPRWVPAGELRKTDRIALFIPEIGTKDVDKNFAYIIGRYVGDGWKTPSGRNKHPYQYYICTPFDEAESFEKYLNNANIKYSRYKNKIVEEFRLSISGDDYLVEILDDCGRYAKDKHVPNDVKFWNRESIIAFLNGYFAADGSYDKRHSVRRFSSISYELILGISELVRMVYHKNVNVTKRIPNPVGVIDGRKINQSVSYEGRYYETEPQRKYYEYDDELHVMWVNVSESKLPVPKFQYVYNLTVSNTHSYIANGAIVHNCSAYNYQENGTPDSRCTYICDMHKARSLANAYFWNTWYRKTNKPERFEIHCPDEWAIPIIGEEELNRLKDLAKEDY